MPSIDIKTEVTCGSCPVALKGDKSHILCSPCYWSIRGISLSSELQEGILQQTENEYHKGKQIKLG